MERAPCVNCGADDAKILFWALDARETVPGERFPVGRCRRCGHGYLVERPSPAEIGRYYPAGYGPHLHRESPERARPSRRHQLIRRRPPFSILDVGCGSGYDLRPFLEQGCRAYGIELDARAADEARKEGVQVQQSSVECASFPDGHFDVITMNHALEHLFEPRAALLNLRRMLRPDGILYLLLPTMDGLMFRLFRQDWYHLDVPRHLQFFTDETMRSIAAAAGFRVLYRGTSSGGKGFYRSMQKVSERSWIGAIAYRMVRFGPGRLFSRVILRYIIDGLRMGDVAEYLLAPAAAARTEDPSPSENAPRP